jgi:putative transcription factor
MLCEMCGKETPSPISVRLEGTVLNLCADCARFGTVVSPPAGAPGPTGVRPGAVAPGSLDDRLRVRARRMEERDLYQELPELELVPDWPKRVRQAREKLGWSPEELGKRLNEKKSLVLKLESGNFRPPDATVRKVEHLLKVRLRANPGELG